MTTNAYATVYYLLFLNARNMHRMKECSGVCAAVEVFEEAKLASLYLVGSCTVASVLAARAPHKGEE